MSVRVVNCLSFCPPQHGPRSGSAAVRWTFFHAQSSYLPDFVMLLLFSKTHDTIVLPRKYILYNTQTRCAFLSLVKMQALFWHTSLCVKNLRGSKELAFFGAWLRAAHFFILPKIKIRWYLRWKANLESINLILNLALMI